MAIILVWDIFFGDREYICRLELNLMTLLEDDIFPFFPFLDIKHPELQRCFTYQNMWNRRIEYQ